MSDSQKPSHKVFVVKDRKGDEGDAFWTRVGSAWPHKDGQGFNIELEALPVSGRLVLRTFTDEDDKGDNDKSVRRVDFKKR